MDSSETGIKKEENMDPRNVNRIDRREKRGFGR